MGAITKERPAAEKDTPPESVFEKAIILRPVSMTTGNIVTNIEAVLAAVREKSSQYQDITRYGGDDKQAKDDRALLRKQKDATKTTIESIKEAWNQPLVPFLDGAKEVLKQFDLAIDTIDDWVKEGEAKEKDKKRQEIQAYFDGKDFDLVPIDRFFNDKWLNKTFKMPDIKQEIDSAISAIYANIKILENIAEHGTTAKAFYLETLDMGAAMRQVETLKANAERLAREKVERESREARAQVTQNAAEERREEQAAVREEKVRSLADEAMDIEEPEVQGAAAPRIFEYTLRFRGTKDQLLNLRKYMTALGIAYEKALVSDTEDESARLLRQWNIVGQIYSVVFIPFDGARLEEAV